MRTKNNNKNIALSGKLTWIVPAISIILFAAIALWYLVSKNADMLFMVQEKSLFTSGTAFFNSCMSQPGGLLIWLGSWLTQLFYYPAFGAQVLVYIWIATIIAYRYAFRISNIFFPVLLIPFICLLAMYLNMGYWIYYLKHQALFFRESLGFLSVALLMLAARKHNKENTLISIIHTSIISIIAGVAYAWTGFYAVVTLLLLALTGLAPKFRIESDKKVVKTINVAIPLVILIVAPLIYSAAFPFVHDGSVYTAGMPAFQAGELTESSRVFPLYIAIASLVAFCFIPYIKELKGKMVGVAIAIYLTMALAMVYYIDKHDFDNEAFHAECAAYRATDEQRWDDVLFTVGNVHGNLTRELIVLKNIALFNTGEAGNRMYHYDDWGVKPETGDSLTVAMNNIASPLILLHHGMLNFSYRWAMENSVEFGFSFDTVKILATVALLNGESELAAKYLDILSGSLFHKEWAERYRQCVNNPKLIAKHKEFSKMLELSKHMGNYVDSDAGLAEKYIMHYFSNTQNKDSKYLQEMTLCYAMMCKNIQQFWPKYLLYLYLHKGEQIPVHYQEAAYMYGCLEPQTAPNPQQYGISFDQKTIIDRYNEFQRVAQGYLASGMSEESVAEATRNSYGDTFWWAYFFNRGSHYY